MTLVVASVAEIRNQYETNGHVILRGVYDSSVAESAAIELSTMQGTRRIIVPGEERISIEQNVDYWRRPNLSTVLDGIGQSALTHIGNPLWPPSSQYRHLIWEILMEPNVEGAGHVDLDNLEGAVAITTLRGTTDLKIGNDRKPTYSGIEPGSVIFLNNALKLWRQAVSGNAPRVGVGLSRLPRKKVKQQ